MPVSHQGRHGPVLSHLADLIQNADCNSRPAASDEINQSVEQVATISAETAQAMGHATHAVAELTQQAQVLKQLIQEMKTQGAAA